VSYTYHRKLLSESIKKFVGTEPKALELSTNEIKIMFDAPLNAVDKSKLDTLMDTLGFEPYEGE